MIESIIVALSPFMLNTVMGFIKSLSQMESTATKRLLLAIFSLIGVIAYHGLTGDPVEPDKVSHLIQAAVEAFVIFIGSHGSYTLFWKKP